jgi:hypothetical protein
MQPVFRSSTTSLIVPISWPSELRTFEPITVLVGMYSVLVLVVVEDEVWA